MRKLAIAALAIVGAFAAIAAYSQQVSMPPPAGTGVIICVYNSSPPTLTTSNPGYVQCDSTGHVLTTSTVSGSVVVTPTTSSGAYAAKTVTGTDSTILAASSTTVFLDLVNDSAVDTICINFGATATITGSACSAGEVTLPPLYHRSWESNYIPTDAIHAISSGSSTAAAVGAK